MNHKSSIDKLQGQPNCLKKHFVARQPHLSRKKKLLITIVCISLVWFESVQAVYRPHNSSSTLSPIVSPKPSLISTTPKPSNNSQELGSYISKILNNFFKSGYDKRVRPSYGGTAAEIAVTMYIVSISSVSEVQMDFTTDFYFRQSWKDKRLSFPPIGNINQIYVGAEVSDRIWVPDTFFANEKSAYFHIATTKNTFLRITNNGDVTRSIRLTVTASCPMNLQYFPMDRQMCAIEIESYGYSMSDIEYKWTNSSNSVTLSKELSLPQFRVLGHRQKEKINVLLTGNYSRLICEIQFARSLGFYLIQIYIPASLIVIISWVSFWLHRNATPARVSLGVTTVLTMTTLMSSTNASLPKISYIKSIDVFLGTCFVMVFGSLLEYAIVGYLGKRISMRKPSPDANAAPGASSPSKMFRVDDQSRGSVSKSITARESLQPSYDTYSRPLVRHTSSSYQPSTYMPLTNPQYNQQLYVPPQPPNYHQSQMPPYASINAGDYEMAPNEQTYLSNSLEHYPAGYEYRPRTPYSRPPSPPPFEPYPYPLSSYNQSFQQPPYPPPFQSMSRLPSMHYGASGPYASTYELNHQVLGSHSRYEPGALLSRNDETYQPRRFPCRRSPQHRSTHSLDLERHNTYPTGASNGLRHRIGSQLSAYDPSIEESRYSKYAPASKLHGGGFMSTGPELSSHAHQSVSLSSARSQALNSVDASTQTVKNNANHPHRKSISSKRALTSQSRSGNAGQLAERSPADANQTDDVFSADDQTAKEMPQRSVDTTTGNTETTNTVPVPTVATTTMTTSISKSGKITNYVSSGTGSQSQSSQHPHHHHHHQHRRSMAGRAGARVGRHMIAGRRPIRNWRIASRFLGAMRVRSCNSPKKICGFSPSDIDKYSRVIFPVSFFCFNLMYWIIYLHISDDTKPDLVPLGSNT